MRTGTQMVRVLHCILHEPHGGRLLLAERLFELLCKRSEIRVILGFGDILAHRLEIGLDRRAALAGELAPAQVHGLHAIGAFVDLGDARIAHELAHPPFLDIAVTAIDLLHVGRDLIALVGTVAFDDRSQETDQLVGLLALFLGLRRMRQIDLKRTPQAQHAEAFGKGLGVHQHAAHIGVDEDRIGLRLGLGRTGQRAALAAIERVGDGVLIGDFGLAQALDTDAEACGVHHDEHGGETLVLLADKPALCVVVVQDAGRVAVNAHLVFDRTADDAVALAHRTVIVHEKFRHHEQRDALGAVGRTGRLGEDEVDDVVRHVVLAGGDKDLRTGDRVAAIGLRFGLRADHAQIGAAMRLGQVHGAGPFVGDHLGKIFLLLLLRSLGEQRGNRTVRQAGIHAEGLVGARHEFLEREAHNVRHALPAEFLRLRQSAPASLAELVVGFLETLRRRDGAVLVARAPFLVTRQVERSQHLGAKLAAFRQDRIGHIGARHLEAGQIAVAGEVEHFVDDETRIAGRGGVGGHWRSSDNGDV